MARYAHPNFLDGGLNYLIATATKVLLLKAYAFGDSYATVTGNKVAESAVAAGDWTKSADGNNRKATLATGKTGTATATTAAGNDLHFAFTDGAGLVLYVTDETTDQVVTSGNPVTFPALAYTNLQPVAA